MAANLERLIWADHDGNTSLADLARDICVIGRLYRFRVPSGTGSEAGPEQRFRRLDTINRRRR
jgi:hypothetical protein